MNETVKGSAPIGPAGLKEIIAWASYDVANSAWATIVATAVYNAYFVSVIAANPSAPDHGKGAATLLLTISICMSSVMIVLSAPVLGTIGDATAKKKAMLVASTVVCVLATIVLGFVGPGQVALAMICLTVAGAAFGTGEDFIAAFLPEIAPKEKMGRISAMGWGAGYVGGLLSLAVALGYVSWAQSQGQPNTQFVPVVMLGCGLMFAIMSLPTFLILRERAVPDQHVKGTNYIKVGYERLKLTFEHARHYQDLFNILICITFYTSGSATVTHLASVYAQEVLHFTQKDSIILILLVNITAAVGAFIFGFIQDRIGSVPTLRITLAMWGVAIFLAYNAQTKVDLWVAGNIVGLAMGASGSAGRALVGRFSPVGRSGEFLGLWGVAVKLATAIGVVSFGLVTYLSGSNFRLALISTGVFFLIGLLLLSRVNEPRGIAAALSNPLEADGLDRP